MFEPITWLYPQGRRRAVTFSYDDGRTFDRKVVAILNQYGMKGTFNLCSSLILNDKNGYYVTREEVPVLYKGHEVAVHTAHHPFLERMPISQAMQEVLEDRKELEKMVGYPVIGMAYSYGTWDETVLAQIKAAGIRYSRTTTNIPHFWLPQNWLTWGATCHHGNALEKMDAFMSRQYPLSVFYIWGHSYEFNDENNWDVLEKICETLPKDDVTWYATNGEIYRYVESVRQLVLGADLHQVYNPTAQEIWFARNDEIQTVKPGELKEI